MTSHLFKLPSLYAIANVNSLKYPLGYVEQLIIAGVEIIQIRAKGWDDKAYAELVASSISIRNKINATCRIIVNDNIQVCADVGADGVHVGQQDISVKEARAFLGDQKIIGHSTHFESQSLNVPFDLLSYMAIGPIFLSSSKTGHAPVVGITELTRLCGAIRQKSDIPIIAIGGITAENAAEVFASGANCVAVIADLAGFSNLSERVKQYEEAYSEALRQ